MRNFRRLLIVLFTAVLISSWSMPAFASENAFKEIFENSLYGGLAGTIIGGALMAFTKKPGDHLDYLYYGAATGVLTGASFGIVKATRSLAEVENGNVKFAFPTIHPSFHDSNARGSSLVVKAELFRGTF